MYSYVNVEDIKIDNKCKVQLDMLYHLYMRHEYDLLGSGYVKVNYKIVAKGFLGNKYFDSKMSLYDKFARVKLRHSCTETYVPINWFVDYKSGFFFEPWKYSSSAKCQKMLGGKRGVDIKCPWELGRLYHLVQLSILAIADEELQENIILEFKNEMIDFIKMNPIGKTVQWSSTMDVSIRLVNMLLAYDILLQLDTDIYLDEKFQIYFEKHINATLMFVMGHLEYTNRISTNHYLSNIAGIIFAAAYLPANNWTDACLNFGVQELIDQFDKQFHAEGSHFEGSTSYHRLCTEFVLYSTALIYGVIKTERRNALIKYDSALIKRLKNSNLQRFDMSDDDFFPKWYTDRLYNAGFFTKTILKSNNEIVQIGDNDSGRLVKLSPQINVNHTSMEERGLDHRALLSAMNGIFTNEEFMKSGEELPLESSMIYSLSKNKQIKGKRYNVHIEEYGDQDIDFGHYEYTKENVIFQNNMERLLDGIEVCHFEQFGIVVLKGSRVFICMILDTAKSALYLGHTHNDKLSLEIMVDNRYITRDPGSYIYTPSVKIRDNFRSIKAHNTICVDSFEQNVFDGVWGMKKRANAELLYCAKNRIIAKLRYAAIECVRDVRMTDHKIVVTDYANKPFKVSFKNKIYSDGYGKLKRVR